MVAIQNLKLPKIVVFRSVLDELYHPHHVGPPVQASISKLFLRAFWVLPLTAPSMSHRSADVAPSHGSVSSPTGPAPFVPLRRANGQSNAPTNSTSEPLWALTSVSDGLAPLAPDCDRDAHSRVVCCKTLKGEDERVLVDPDVVRDM